MNKESYSQYYRVFYFNLPRNIQRAIDTLLRERGYNLKVLDLLRLYRYTYKHSLTEDYRIDGLFDHLDNPLFTIYVHDNSHGYIATNYKPYREFKF